MKKPTALKEILPAHALGLQKTKHSFIGVRVCGLLSETWAALGYRIYYGT